MWGVRIPYIGIMYIKWPYVTIAKISQQNKGTAQCITLFSHQKNVTEKIVFDVVFHIWYHSAMSKPKKQQEPDKKLMWSTDLRNEFGSVDFPMSRNRFNGWVKKAEKITGLKRVYEGMGQHRKMYLEQPIVDLLRLYHKMKKVG